jgi:phage terminase Nu1 subunit (DNA packaging protein)
MRVLEELALGGKPVLRIGSADLCELLAISPAALSDLKKRGIAVHHGHDAYNLVETVTAYVTHLRGVAAGRGGEEHTSSLTAERARLAREQADAQALKNATIRGELVPAADVERAWGDVLRQVRSRILAVPSRLRQSLHLQPDVASEIDRELRDALTELGNADD